MLPSLLTKHTFLLTMSILPEDNGNYNIIIGKETMKAVSINANILEGIFTWNELAIPMVTKGYWTEQAINELIVHHFSKTTLDPASADSITAPTRTASKPTANNTAICSALCPYCKTSPAPKSLGEKANN